MQSADSREPLLDMKSMTMKRPARCGSVLELPAREALADEPTVGGVNASPAAQEASLSAKGGSGLQPGLLLNDRPEAPWLLGER
jgi:hypothetical protein